MGLFGNEAVAGSCCADAAAANAPRTIEHSGAAQLLQALMASLLVEISVLTAGPANTSEPRRLMAYFSAPGRANTMRAALQRGRGRCAAAAVAFTQGVHRAGTDE